MLRDLTCPKCSNADQDKFVAETEDAGQDPILVSEHRQADSPYRVALQILRARCSAGTEILRGGSMNKAKRVWIGRWYVGCAWGGPSAWGFHWHHRASTGARMLTLSVYRVSVGIGKY